jgi:CRP-like cAMP-binding protein
VSSAGASGIEESLPPAARAELGFLPRALLAQARCVKVDTGTVLFHLGEQPALLYYVLDGEIALLRHSIRGQAIVLQRARRGLLAEASVESRRYHCDGVARVPSRVCTLPLGALRRALAEDAAFAAAWARHLAGEIRRLRARAERLQLHGAEARIVHYLESEGVEGAVELDQPLKSWALELGLTHEALYRALARMTRAGRLLRTGSRLRLRR